MLINTEAIIVSKISKNAPANLYLQHFNAFLLESYKPFKFNVLLLVTLQLFHYYLLDGLDVLDIQLTLKHSLLQFVNFRVIEFPIQIGV